MKDATFIGGACLVAIAIGGLLFFYGLEARTGSSSGAPREGAAVSFSIVGEGAVAASIGESANFRIKNARELETLWSLVYGSDVPAMPAVDFETEEVLAVFDGQHPTGGYRIAVAGIHEDDEVRTVFIRHEMPDAACIVTEALTSPFAIVVAPKGAQTLSREDETVTTPCN